MDKKTVKSTSRPMVVKKIKGSLDNPLIKTIEKIKIKVPEGCPSLHTTAVFVGSCNSGKTNWMLNLAKKYEDFGSFNRIFVLSPTYDNNKSFDILHIEPEDVYSGKRVLDNGVECVCEVEDKIKKLAEEYAEYEIYVKAYQAWINGVATMRQQAIVERRLYAEPEYMPMPRVLLLMDDLSHTKVFSVAKDNKFINLLLRHRHIYGIGLTIFAAVQNFTTGLPKILRQNIKQFYLWKTHDSTQLKCIYEQVAQGCSEIEFYQAFDIATREPHSFLTVDLDSKSESVFRSNFDREIVFIGEPPPLTDIVSDEKKDKK